MSEDFDPYRKWLGIPPKDQPPNHYRLLGIANFEDDPDVIENAASRQMVHVRTFQSGKHSAISQRILNELAAAKLCLLQPAKKSAYDQDLRARLAAAGQLSSEALDAAVEDDAMGIPPPPPTDFRSGEGRWRTGDEAEPVIPFPGPAPVPIPMPPAVPPPVAVAAPVVNLQKGRRSAYSSTSRGRKKSSALPMLLIAGSIGLLALAGIAAALIAMNASEPERNHTKQNPAGSDKPTGKRSSAPHTPFTVGSQGRVQRFPTPRPQSTSSQPAKGSASTPLAEPDFRGELAKARAALAKRNDGDFKLHISQTGYLLDLHKPGNADELKADEAHLRDVDKLLSSFWQAVREGTDKKIPKGEKFKFRNQELELVRREGEQLTYRLDGKEEVAAIKKLPARIATMIAYRVFGNDNLEGKLAMAVFLAVDSDAAEDPGNARLAAHLREELHQAGVASHPIIEREVGKLPKSPPTSDDDFSPPMVTVAAPLEKSTDSQGGSPANTPDPMLVKEAREKFNKEFRERMLEATQDAAAARTLLGEFAGEVAKAETAEYKVKLLKDGVIDLAARIGDCERIVAAAQEIAALNGENAEVIQLQGFRQVNLDSPAAPQQLLQHARAAAGKAEANGDLFRAIELLQIAKRAADKGKLAAESQAVEAKLQELEKARAEEK